MTCDYGKLLRNIFGVITKLYILNKKRYRLEQNLMRKWEITLIKNDHG